MLVTQDRVHRSLGNIEEQGLVLSQTLFNELRGSLAELTPIVSLLASGAASADNLNRHMVRQRRS